MKRRAYGTMAEKLERLLELSTEATPAPWEAYTPPDQGPEATPGSIHGSTVYSKGHPTHPGQSVCDVLAYNNESDAEFIALAREVGPWAARDILERHKMTEQGVAGMARLHGYFSLEELSALVERMRATQESQAHTEQGEEQ